MSYYDGARQLANGEVPTLAKGDVVGHTFHGNQYSAGGAADKTYQKAKNEYSSDYGAHLEARDAARAAGHRADEVSAQNNMDSARYAEDRKEYEHGEYNPENEH